MSTLVIAEHDNSSLKGATLNAVTAAQALGGDIDILVAGAGCSGAAEAAATVGGIGKVLVADNAVYEHQLAENVSLLIAEIAAGYDNIVAAATTNGKPHAFARFSARTSSLRRRHRTNRLMGGMNQPTE